MVAVLGASCACGSARASGSGSTSGGLSDHDRATATAIARHQAELAARSVAIATATVGVGTVTDSNTGHKCSSGRLLHIKVTGEWNIAHGFARGPMESTGPPDKRQQTVIIEADQATGFACLLSFAPHAMPPDPGATVLFENWHR